MYWAYFCKVRRNKQPVILQDVLVENFAAEGKSLARVNGKVIFIENTIPGDIVDIQLGKSKKDWAEAFPIAFKKLSANRLQPFCSHFGVCGGCQWQMLPYKEQLAFKQQQVTDHLQRIGKIELPEMLPIIGAEKTVGYRNKIEYTFATRRFIPKDEFKQLRAEGAANNTDSLGEAMQQGAAGFHAKGQFDKVVEIDNCYLQEEPTNAIRKAIVQFAKENNYPFYDIKQHEGWLRNMVIRIATTGEIMVNVVVANANKEMIDGLQKMLLNTFPSITTLLFTINAKFNDSIYDLEPKTVYGKGFIIEKLESFQFKISPKSFFQTNTLQGEKLYQVTRDFAELNGSQVVYDLYCGTGSIGIFCSKQAKKIVGVELIEDAIIDAKENATLNNIEHSFFIAGDVINICDDAFFEQHGKPDVIITDPPRAGMHEKLVKKLLEIEAPVMVYVSCNPATQARDLALLDEKYVVTKIQPVDMFPHTHHIENVVQLKLKQNL